jgi:hypothetical protein
LQLEREQRVEYKLNEVVVMSSKYAALPDIVSVVLDVDGVLLMLLLLLLLVYSVYSLLMMMLHPQYRTPQDTSNPDVYETPDVPTSFSFGVSVAVS